MRPLICMSNCTRIKSYKAAEQKSYARSGLEPERKVFADLLYIRTTTMRIYYTTYLRPLKWHFMAGFMNAMLASLFFSYIPIFYSDDSRSLKIYIFLYAYKFVVQVHRKCICKHKGRVFHTLHRRNNKVSRAGLNRTS